MVTPTGQQGPARLTVDDNDKKRLDDYVLYVRLGLGPLNERNKLFSSSGGRPLENTAKLLAKIEKNLGAVVCALSKLPLCYYCYQARLRKAARELLEYEP